MARTKKNGGFSDKASMFIDQYLIDFNATQAAIRAGFSKATAKVQASRLLAKKEIQSELSRRFEKEASKLGATKERVMTEIVRVAFSDVRQLFDDNGNLMHIKDLPDDIALSVSSIEIDKSSGKSRSRRKADQEAEMITTTKVKMWSKEKALEMLAKHFKIYSDAPEVQNNITFGYGPEKPV